MPAPYTVAPPLELEYHAHDDSNIPIPPIRPPKRLPSARAAFRLEEIPVVAEQMTGHVCA